MSNEPEFQIISESSYNEQFVGKAIIVFDENGVGVRSIEWPWSDRDIDHLNSIDATYSIEDKRFPDAYWIDVSDPDLPVVLREPVEEFTISKTKASTQNDNVIIDGLPDECQLVLGGSVVLASKSYTFTPEHPGFVWIALTGPHVSGGFNLEVVDLLEYKSKTKAGIDTAAEDCRNRVITPGSGQAMTYLRKAEAAKAFLAGGMADGPQKQRIIDEAERLGVTPEQAAQAIVAIADGWEAMDRLVDKTRLDAKAAIDGAITLDAIDAICENLTWPA